MQVKVYGKDGMYFFNQARPLPLEQSLLCLLASA